jgi:hypothetical protein
MIWWVDAGAGASGDMLLGALLDLDPDGLAHAAQAVDEVLQRLGAPGAVEFALTPTTRAGLRAARAHVRSKRTEAARTWRDIRRALDGLTPASAVFASLAAAEATVHGIDPDDVHFHEVGALDAIADIVACTVLQARLAPQQVVVSAVCVGSGTTATAHGELTVPVPAVVEMLRGVPTFSGPVAHEACTPTGAALLRHMATGWGGQPPMAVDRVGVGAGGRDTGAKPNVLRILAGTPCATGTESLVLVGTTIDDLDPRLYPDVLAATKAAGALECWLTPVVMKHGRPAVEVSALAPPAAADDVARALFTHTTTLGVRFTEVSRRSLDRDIVTVEVGGRAVRVKRGWLDGVPVTIQPEYRDAVAVAQAMSLPVRRVIDDAARAARSHGE